LDSKAGTIVIILGPTSVGKSRTGLKLALKLSGEIINCDSMQVYRGFDIGTDKPSLEARRAVPHHLIDVADPSDQFTAADFVRGALRALDIIHGKKKLPFIIGGTGLYIKALLDGLFPGPGRDLGVRRRLEAEAKEKGLATLFNRLETIDPAYARKVRSRDKVRIVRALEVFESTGKPISEHFRGTESLIKDAHLVRIGLRLDRPSLIKRIEERVERMFAGGLVEEVDLLLGQGVREDAPPFRALGYRWVLKFIRNEVSLEEAKARTKLDTRHYAKRQMTWFQKMGGVAWFTPEDDAALENHLAKNIK
jgi:tRNA dimethylallyltransferase